MTKYREIIRLAGLNLSQTNIALSVGASKDYGQQGFESCQRAEPRMAIGAKIH